MAATTDADVDVNIIIASASAVEMAVTGSGSSFFSAAAVAAASSVKVFAPSNEGASLFIPDCHPSYSFWYSAVFLSVFPF